MVIGFGREFPMLCMRSNSWDDPRNKAERQAFRRALRRSSRQKDRIEYMLKTPE